MKKSLLYSVIVCMATLLVFSSCKNEPIQEPLHLTVQCSASNPSAEGVTDANLVVIVKEGMAWFLEKPADASWITFDVTEGTKTTIIPCKIAPNEGPARSAVLTATADGVKPFQLTIRQAAPKAE